MSNTMKSLCVLMVTPRFLPYVGGVETHTFEVAKRIASAGNRVTVLTADPTRNLPAVDNIGDVRILRTKAWPRERDYYFAPDIYPLVAGGTWDIVHCQSYHTLVAPLAMSAAWRSHKPYVVTFHSGGHTSRLRTSARSLQRLVLRPLLARAERLVGVSRFEAELFRVHLGLPHHQFSVIPNGSHLPLPDSVPALPTLEAPLILSIGRLERYKGHHRVIAAMPHILASYPRARLRIVGTGPFEEELLRLCDRLGVVDQVEVSGISGVDRLGMAHALAQASLVTLLSEYEAHPISVMEALSLGRPVLVTYTSGLAELADAGLVRAIAPQSEPREIAAAILDQLRQPFAPKKVVLPTWDDCAASHLALYHAVLRGSRCDY